MINYGYLPKDEAQRLMDSNTRPRLAAADTIAELRRRVLRHVDWLAFRGYDELAEELYALVDGHDADADCDVYGNTLEPPP